MFKKWRKPLAGLLALLLMWGGIEYIPPISAQAEGGGSTVSGNEAAGSEGVVISYEASELTFTNRWNSDQVYENAQFEFTDQYQEAWCALPQEIDLEQCEAVTFKVADQGGTIAFKFYDADNKEIKAFYGCVGSTEYQRETEGLTGTVVRVAVMSTEENKSEESVYPYGARFVGVSFQMKENASEGGNGENEEDENLVSNLVSYEASELTFTNRWNSDQVYENAQFEFTDQYQEAWCALPQEIDLEQCEAVTFKVADQGGTIAFKFYDADNKEIKAFYGCVGSTEYQRETEGLTGTVVRIAVMSTEENKSEESVYPYGARFVGVSFQMKENASEGGNGETEEDENLVSYEASELTFTNRWNSDQVYENAQFEFTDQYQEAWCALPQEIDLEQCEAVTFKVADQGGTIAFKFYDADNKEIKAFYGCVGSTEYQRGTEGLTGTVVRIAVMSTEENKSEESVYPYGAKFISVSFKMLPSEDKVIEKTFTMDKLESNIRWGGASVDGNRFSYEKLYDEVWLALPEEINADQCTKVTFEVANQELQLCFKLYDAAYADLGTFYNKKGATKYEEVSSVGGKIKYIGVMAQDEEVEYPSSTDFVGVTFQIDTSIGAEEGDGKDIPFDTNLIINPDFADADNLAVWTRENGTISAEIAETAIYDNVKTYGKVSDRTSNYQGFAQVITDVMEKNQEYQFSFYAMLDPVDYADAPESQRVVEIAPYINVEGKDTNYGTNIKGTTKQVLEPGVWTKFSGTFTPSWTGNMTEVVLRIIEQGENYGQGDGVKGKYYVTGVDLHKEQKAKPEIEQDIPNWKDTIVEALGEGTIAGTAITQGELNDEVLMDLVHKHFNAVTFGNELKPDAIFNYSNDKCPGTVDITFNGKAMTVPVTNFSRADEMADAIVAWNEANPDNYIRIRGHVLVWHSQTPEWFFHEDYDAAKPYVDKDTMNLRMEWYISTVLGHYFGADSKYADVAQKLFYGWDVVNEAVSDGSGSYRTDKENSSWWAVYQSNEFIINAFKYANKYAPESLELYYNDYGDISPTKSTGIAKLVQDVKDAEGTRITALGMQGHYNVADFSVAQFEEAIRKYAKVINKVQITEYDYQSGGCYDGTEATRESAYTKYAYCHKQAFDVMKKLEAEGVIDVTNITTWGVIEPNSWLHQHASVGGGADGKTKQCPLLFDGNYKAKPAYWAYVDPTKLEPSIQSITITQSENDSYDESNAYSIGEKGGVTASFIPAWNASGLKVLVKVQDPTADENDSVTVYVDKATLAANATGIIAKTVKRSEGKAVSGGYEVEVAVEASGLSVTQQIKLDVVVASGSEKVSFNDFRNTQDTSSKYYAAAILKPGIVEIPDGTVTIDGVKEDKWADAAVIPLTINLGSKVTSKASLLWDETYLYVFAEVKDADLNDASADAYQQDSLEVFIDENNHKSTAYEEDDKQYRVNYKNVQSFNGNKCNKDNITSAAKITDDGYVIEAAFKWTDITPKADTLIGLELQINDAASSGKRIGTLSWFDQTGMGWSSPAVYGTVKLVKTPAPAGIVAAEVSETIPESVMTSEVKAVTGCATVAQLTDYLKSQVAGGAGAAAILPGVPTSQVSVMEVAVKVSFDGGATWVAATADNFPSAGVDVILPYPAGVNKANYNFVVAHLVVMAVNGQKPGTTEYLKPVKTDDGLKVHVMSASPFAIGWKEISAAPAPTPTPTPAPAPAPAETPSVQAPVKQQVPVPVEYIVKKGDTLSRIARNNKMTLKELIALNPQIKNPNLIFPGQKILLGYTLGTLGDATDSKAADAQAVYYVVVKGDSLYKIARMNRISLNKIIAMNPEISRQKYIYAGQRVRVK